MHIASAVGVSTVSIFCHNPMCRTARWGALGDKAHNIEVPEDFCTANCKEVVKDCQIESGISITRVVEEINSTVSSS
jgi:hypothetical protein